MADDLTPDEERLSAFLEGSAPDDAKRQAVQLYQQMQAEAGVPASSAAPAQPGLLGAVGETATGAAKGWLTSLNRLTSGQEPDLWNAVGDVGTVAAPIVAPEATAVGLGARAAVRPFTSPGTADLVGNVASVGATLPGLYRAGSSLLATRAAQRGVSEGTARLGAELGAAGEQAQAESLAHTQRLGIELGAAGEQANATRTAAQGEQSAATVLQGAEKRLATAKAAVPAPIPETPPGPGELAGAGLKENISPAVTAVRDRAQAIYARVAQYAADKGLAITPGTPEAETLAQSLERTEAKWGPNLASREKDQITALLAKLRGGAEPSPDVGLFGNQAPLPTPPEPIPYADLDAARRSLVNVRGISSVDKALAQAMQSLVNPTPVGKLLQSAGVAWRVGVKPAQKFATVIDRAESPAKAFQATVGTLKDAYRARLAQGLLGADSPHWLRVRGGVVETILQNAGNDAGKAADLWEKVSPEMQKVIDPQGDIQRFFGGLRQLDLRATSAVESAQQGVANAREGLKAPGQQLRTTQMAIRQGRSAAVSNLQDAASQAKDRIAQGRAAAVANIEDAQKAANDSAAMRRSLLLGGRVSTGTLGLAGAAWDAAHGRAKQAVTDLAVAGGIAAAGPAALAIAHGAIGTPKGVALAALIVRWAAGQSAAVQDAAMRAADELRGSITATAVGQ